MARLLHFVTHPEVEVQPRVPVPEWGLSDAGRRRVQGLLEQPWVPAVRHVFASGERKAIETATALAEAQHLTVQVEPELGENDRSSTGYLPSDQFEPLADRFFAEPTTSVCGWETAQAAQQRVVRAVRRCLTTSTSGDVAIIAHGAVGTLLWCHLEGMAIDRCHDQPGQGSHYAVDIATMTPLSAWVRLPLPGASRPGPHLGGRSSA